MKYCSLIILLSFSVIQAADTTLHGLMEDDNSPTIMSLLNAKANPNARNHQGENMVHVGVRHVEISNISKCSFCCFSRGITKCSIKFG